MSTRAQDPAVSRAPAPQTAIRGARLLDSQRVLAYALLFPSLAVLGFIVVYPFFSAIVLSFFDKYIGAPATYVGTSLGELSTSGWDQAVLLNEKLVHIESTIENFSRSPMARLHVYGHMNSVFSELIEVHHNLTEQSKHLLGSMLNFPNNSCDPSLAVIQPGFCADAAIGTVHRATTAGDNNHAAALLAAVKLLVNELSCR